MKGVFESLKKQIGECDELQKAAASFIKNLQKPENIKFLSLLHGNLLTEEDQKSLKAAIVAMASGQQLIDPQKTVVNKSDFCHSVAFCVADSSKWTDEQKQMQEALQKIVKLESYYLKCRNHIEGLQDSETQKYFYNNLNTCYAKELIAILTPFNEKIHNEQFANLNNNVLGALRNIADKTYNESSRFFGMGEAPPSALSRLQSVKQAFNNVLSSGLSNYDTGIINSVATKLQNDALKTIKDAYNDEIGFDWLKKNSDNNINWNDEHQRKAKLFGLDALVIGVNKGLLEGGSDIAKAAYYDGFFALLDNDVNSRFDVIKQFIHNIENFINYAYSNPHGTVDQALIDRCTKLQRKIAKVIVQENVLRLNEVQLSEESYLEFVKEICGVYWEFCRIAARESDSLEVAKREEELLKKQNAMIQSFANECSFNSSISRQLSILDDTAKEAFIRLKLLQSSGAINESTFQANWNKIVSISNDNNIGQQEKDFMFNLYSYNVKQHAKDARSVLVNLIDYHNDLVLNSNSILDFYPSFVEELTQKSGTSIDSNNRLVALDKFLKEWTSVAHKLNGIEEKKIINAVNSDAIINSNHKRGYCKTLCDKVLRCGDILDIGTKQKLYEIVHYAKEDKKVELSNLIDNLYKFSNLNHQVKKQNNAQDRDYYNKVLASCSELTKEDLEILNYDANSLSPKPIPSLAKKVLLQITTIEDPNARQQAYRKMIVPIFLQHKIEQFTKEIEDKLNDKNNLDSIFRKKTIANLLEKDQKLAADKATILLNKIEKRQFDISYNPQYSDYINTLHAKCELLYKNDLIKKENYDIYYKHLNTFSLLSSSSDVEEKIQHITDMLSQTAVVSQNVRTLCEDTLKDIKNNVNEKNAIAELQKCQDILLEVLHRKIDDDYISIHYNNASNKQHFDKIIQDRLKIAQNNFAKQMAKDFDNPNYHFLLRPGIRQYKQGTAFELSDTKLTTFKLLLKLDYILKQEQHASKTQSQQNIKNGNQSLKDLSTVRELYLLATDCNTDKLRFSDIVRQNKKFVDFFNRINIDVNHASFTPFSVLKPITQWMFSKYTDKYCYILKKDHSVKSMIDSAIDNVMRDRNSKIDEELKKITNDAYNDSVKRQQKKPEVLSIFISDLQLDFLNRLHELSFFSTLEKENIKEFVSEYNDANEFVYALHDFNKYYKKYKNAKNNIEREKNYYQLHSLAKELIENEEDKQIALTPEDIDVMASDINDRMLSEAENRCSKLLQSFLRQYPELDKYFNELDKVAKRDFKKLLVTESNVPIQVDDEVEEDNVQQTPTKPLNIELDQSKCGHLGLEMMLGGIVASLGTLGTFAALNIINPLFLLCAIPVVVLSYAVGTQIKYGNSDKKDLDVVTRSEKYYLKTDVKKDYVKSTAQEKPNALPQSPQRKNQVRSLKNIQNQDIRR